jgi:hypothetical protein
VPPLNAALGVTRAQILGVLNFLKIKLCLTVITIDYIDLKKNRNATLELRDAKNSIASLY